MKIPRKSIKAKVDTNKNQRALNSSYQRRGDRDIFKKKSSQEINERRASMNARSLQKSHSEEKNNHNSNK